MSTGLFSPVGVGARPRIVLSTYWCCPSRPCVIFLAIRAPDIVPCILWSQHEKTRSCLEKDINYIIFLQATPLFPHVVTIVYARFLALTLSNSSLFTPAVLRNHSIVFVAVHKTRRIFLSPFVSKVPRLRSRGTKNIAGVGHIRSCECWLLLVLQVKVLVLFSPALQSWYR